MGEAYKGLNDHDKAIASFIAGLQKHVGFFGENHPEISNFQVELAEVTRLKGDKSRAKEFMEKALNIR